MRRTLWKMSDYEVFKLRDAAHAILTNLHVEHTSWLGWVAEAKDRLTAIKTTSPEHRKLAWAIDCAYARINHIEQRIMAQRSFVTSLDNECANRNPPFWSQDDLDMMDRRR